MPGLLTPYATTELVKALRAAVSLPIHLHSHATSGLSGMCFLKAVEAGATMLDTCNSSFGEGASHTSPESIVAALPRMNEGLAEIPRVREGLGYPPLVTPTSQIVGTQAVLNVLTGARYKSVTNEAKNSLLGH